MSSMRVSGKPLSHRLRKVSWAIICARVKRLVRLKTSASVNLPNHSLCQRTSVRLRSTILKNWSM